MVKSNSSITMQPLHTQTLSRMHADTMSHWLAGAASEWTAKPTEPQYSEGSQLGAATVHANRASRLHAHNPCLQCVTRWAIRHESITQPNDGGRWISHTHTHTHTHKQESRQGHTRLNPLSLGMAWKNRQIDEKMDGWMDGCKER